MIFKNFYLFLILSVFVSISALASETNFSRISHIHEPVSTIIYRGKTIKLSEKAIYINAKLKKENMGKFAFNTLQAAVNFAKNGTEEQPTILYLAPDVYWTDDPNSENKENRLIGMVIPQSNITMIGLSDNPAHTIIAGNRGQMAGAIGNWNTIGVGDGFKAYNITFGNYCNVDLVYELDPSKNFPKRQNTITQAQTVTTAYRGEMDKWIFDNCHFISFLNVFAAGRQPHRTYYTNCFFQCTDDAIGSGDISVFNNVKFKFYSNHPSWGGSSIIQAYLGCSFETVLRDPGANSTIFFAKNNASFAVLDANFDGNAQKLEWTDNLDDNARHYVYNNFLNKKKVIISPSKPELSVNLNPESLKAFKVGDEYNIYNLLRGDDDWDPAGQKKKFAAYKDLAFRIKLNAAKTRLKNGEKVLVSYAIYPERVKTKTPVKWSVSNKDLLSFIENADGTVTITANNSTDKTLKGYLKGETASGIESLIHFEVMGNPLPAPVFTKNLTIGNPENGKIGVDYSLALEGREDVSQIDWYRSTLPDGSDSVKVAVSRLNTPLKMYTLSSGDTGYYLLAKVYPQHSTSVAGTPVTVISRMIVTSDITDKNISTDFKNLPTEKTANVRDGFWTLNTYRPADLSSNFKWESDLGNAWSYGIGNAGTAGRYGLSTSGRGARLLYSQPGIYKDMAVVLELSPQKSSGQGFGSATGQYLDIYTKFDAKTLTGYGLRIERTAEYAEAVRFTLYKFTNGTGTPISESQYSSAFLPGCKVILKVSGDILTAKVTTTTPQQASQKSNNLMHEVNLSAKIQANQFGGFGVQHTGSVSGGNRIMLERLSVEY